MDYFSRIVHDDMDAILRDLREAHRKDATTADEGAGITGNDVKELMEKATSMPVEDTIADVIFQKLGIPREQLTDEELTAFISVLSKATKKSSVINMRGRFIPHGHGTGKRKR